MEQSAPGMNPGMAAAPAEDDPGKAGEPRAADAEHVRPVQIGMDDVEPALAHDVPDAVDRLEQSHGVGADAPSVGRPVHGDAGLLELRQPQANAIEGAYLHLDSVLTNPWCDPRQVRLSATHI